MDPRIDLCQRATRIGTKEAKATSIPLGRPVSHPYYERLVEKGVKREIAIQFVSKVKAWLEEVEA
jgi:hypothetical protein